MVAVETNQFDETFVIQFGTDGARINAYTLATAIVAIADAAKSANVVLNPGYEIEVLVEAIAPGSFKATIRAVYHGAANLFSTQNLKAIVLGVIASYIYTKALAPSAGIAVVVNTDEVVIEQGDTRIVIPRSVHDATQQAAEVPEFREGVSRVFQALEQDPQVSYVAIYPSSEELWPERRIPRERFRDIADAAVIEQAGTREFVETTEVQITRAILERSRKRWQFVWRGVRISAPVLDDRFYDKFFSHEITIAPGDTLQVRLRVRQRLDPDTGIYVNEVNGYEVLEVLAHHPRAKQESARFST